MDQSLPDQPQAPIENVPVESIASAEVAETAPVYETPVAPVAEAVKSQPAQTVAPTPTPADSGLNVVDMRSSHDQTKPLATPGVQKLTTIADKEEDEFIQDVEKTHSST